MKIMSAYIADVFERPNDGKQFSRRRCLHTGIVWYRPLGNINVDWKMGYDARYGEAFR